MARSWLCYIGAVKAAVNTVGSVISYESEGVRSKSLKEDSAATTHVCRASNEKACIEESTRRMGASILLTRASSVNREYDFDLLMPFLRLLHCSWDEQATSEAARCRVSIEKRAKAHTVTGSR